jgi:predicted nucleic acid-binding protein
MPELIIADASCLIILTKIGRLDLLRQLYGTATTTPVVAAEYGLPLPEWIRQEEATDTARQQLLTLLVDAGEASAIALALERPGCTLILDDYKARKTAEKLSVQLTGTFGVLLRAKRQGLVPAVKPLLEQIRQTNFRFSAALEMAVLKQAGE